MSYFTQYKKMLDSLEDGDSKTDLSEGLIKLEGIFDDAIESRDKSKTKVRDLTSVIDGISKEFDLEEVSVDGLKGVLDNTKNDDELKAGYETKLDELRTLLSGKDDEVNGFKGKYEALVFKSDIFKRG